MSIGQIMAECDCQHTACKVRGYCMAARIAGLEAENARLEAWQAAAFIVHSNLDLDIEGHPEARAALDKGEG